MNRTGRNGRTLKPTPQAWTWAIDDYVNAITAAGQREATRKLRRAQLRNMARGLGCPPDEVTAERLVDWFGRQRDWSLEHRRSNRSAAKGFFSWMYTAGRIAVYLGDALPTIRQPPASPHPAPDDAWEAAMSAADPRTTLMLRLAAECGLRRAEVACVHTRDVFIAGGSAQLVVHGKGGKQRNVPISRELAALIRRGAAGHTPAMGAFEWGIYGWLFPDGDGGHLSAQWVGKVVGRVLPDGYSMHALRHRFASRAYRGTRNLRAVQLLLGHSSIATTERYTAVDDDEIRAAAASAW